MSDYVSINFQLSYVHDHLIPPNASILIISHDRNGDVRFIMTEENRNKFNVYGLPGGGMKQRENHFEAAIRELREETRLEFNSAWHFVCAIVVKECVTYVYDAGHARLNPIACGCEVARVVRMRSSELSRAIDNKTHLMTTEGRSLRLRESCWPTFVAGKKYVGL